MTWTLGYSLALWGYDVNNTTNSSLKVTLSTLITKSNLDNAVQIIEEYLGKPGKLDTSFKYQLPKNHVSFLVVFPLFFQDLISHKSMH